MKDLSRNYAAPDLAQGQRTVVNEQLVRLRKGDLLNYFEAVGKAASEIGQTLSSARLLDVGCGTAYYSEVLEVLKPGWAEYTGVDYNEGMLELAAQYYPDLTLCQADIYNLPFPDRSFDVVLSGACITHVKDWKRAVDELRRVTKWFLLLHRNSMRDVTVLEPFKVYGTELFHWFFNESELLEAVSDLLFVESYRMSSSSVSYLLRRLQE